MNNKLKLVALALIVGASGCKKNDIIPNKDNPAISNLNTQSFTNARTLNNKTMSDYINVPGDEDMTKMNKGLYLYMEGMKEVFAERPQMLDYVLNKIKSTGKNSVIVTNYLSYFGVCKGVFNTKLTELCPEKPIGTDHATSVALEYMNYQGTSQHVPTMLLYNNCFELVTIDNLNGYRLAFGVDAPESANNGNGGTKGTGVLIPCWNISKTGDVKLELISEQEAAHSTIPVYIFTPGYFKNGTEPAHRVNDNYDYVNINDGDGGVFIQNGGCANAPTGGSASGGGTTGINSNVGQTPGTGEIYLRSVSLAYYYEASMASELRLSAIVNDDEQSGRIENLKLLDIPRNYIDCTCSHDVGTTLMTGLGSNSNSTYAMLLFEYDWYATDKTHYHTSNAGQPLQMKYRATNSNDIYEWQYFYVDTELPTVGYDRDFIYLADHAHVVRY